MLKNLELNKLIKELSYINSNLSYKRELLKEIDNNFLSAIDTFLESYPTLKDIYDKINKVDEISDSNEIINEETDINIINNDINDDITTYDSNNLKHIYREIVKLTHPDKVTNKKLNSIYIDATNYYNSGDKYSLFEICELLDIDYDFNDEDLNNIQNIISDKVAIINMMEETFVWKWYKSESDLAKKNIILDYIKLKIS